MASILNKVQRIAYLGMSSRLKTTMTIILGLPPQRSTEQNVMDAKVSLVILTAIPASSCR